MGLGWETGSGDLVSGPKQDLVWLEDWTLRGVGIPLTRAWAVGAGGGVRGAPQLMGMGVSFALTGLFLVDRPLRSSFMFDILNSWPVERSKNKKKKNADHFVFKNQAMGMMRVTVCLHRELHGYA